MFARLLCAVSLIALPVIAAQFTQAAGTSTQYSQSAPAQTTMPQASTPKMATSDKAMSTKSSMKTAQKSSTKSSKMTRSQLDAKERAITSELNNRSRVQQQSQNMSGSYSQFGLSSSPNYAQPRDIGTDTNPN